MHQPDINKLFQQLQHMQQEVLRLQEELKKIPVEGTAGGGAVTVKCNGAMEFYAVKIRPDAVDAEDLSMLEDLVVLAVNNAIVQCQDLAQNNLKLPPGMGGGF
ncbi:MAG: YbaB/EbfC family nucleoid-associated protein [Candidatus Obscuribacterales bacterium]|nr:YbaB/EbfC family nucleoid-associated protein [Candidatus Obscuribacterales bacterium]